MKYFLIKDKTNFSDEFDLEGYALEKDVTKSQVKKNLIDRLKREHGDFPMELYFGSNESIIYQNKEHLLEDIEIKEISKSEYDTIYKVLGQSFGLSAIF